jgi:Abortive infection alpha
LTRPLSGSAPKQSVQEVVSAVLTDLASRLDEEALRRTLSEAITTTISSRGIPQDCLKLPRLDVVMPAMDALRYAPAVQAFGALIAYSMDSRTSPRILPAYVEMLKQLSLDELQILGRMPSVGRFEALANLVHMAPNKQVLSVYRNIIPAAYATCCERPSEIPKYIDNLVRLNLLYKPAGQQVDEVSYRTLSRIPFVRSLMAQVTSPLVAGLDRETIGISDLGEGFRQACVV